MQIVRAVLLSIMCWSATSAALAGAKDESAAAWLFPQSFNDWHDALANRGVSLDATYIADTIGNVTGGMQQGVIEFGRLDIGVDTDFEKQAGWRGTTAHANIFAIYGNGLTRNYIGNLAPVSEIEALPDVRLYEAYIEQSFWGGALLVKIGQQAADADFFDSKTDDLFINGTFGWPAIDAVNLPAGGPSPPIAVPGFSVKAKLAPDITAFAAIFNGDPAEPGSSDAQLRDHHGLAFRLDVPPWIIGQVEYDYMLKIAGMNLPASITPGAWYHSGNFDDQRFDIEGLSLADPSGTGVPARLNGNYGIFVTLEQTLYRPLGDKVKEVSASTPGVTAFARAAYCPPDRNLIDYYFDGGVGIAGLVPGRQSDRFGTAIAYMHISSAVTALDLDSQSFTGLPTPVRNFEAVWEVIYEAHIKSGWLLQPFFQFVIHPSGGAPNPRDPTGLSRLGDALVFGLTTTLKY